MQGESPPVQVKEPNSSLHDYLYFDPLQNRCVQCTPAHNPRERCSSMYCIERHHHLSTYMKLMPFSYHLHPDMFMFLPNSSPYHVASTTSLVKLVFILLIFQGVGSAGVGSSANVTTNKLTANRIPSLYRLCIVVYLLEGGKQRPWTKLYHRESDTDRSGDTQEVYPCASPALSVNGFWIITFEAFNFLCRYIQNA